MAKRKYDPATAREQERAQEHANWLDLVHEDQMTTNLHTPAFTTPATCPCGCGSQAADVPYPVHDPADYEPVLPDED